MPCQDSKIDHLFSLHPDNLPPLQALVLLRPHDIADTSPIEWCLGEDMLMCLVELACRTDVMSLLYCVLKAKSKYLVL